MLIINNIWRCRHCWKTNDYNQNSKDKNCYYCWKYLDYLDEKYIEEQSDYWRYTYKQIKIIEFAVKRWYKLDWIRKWLFTIKVRVKSLEPSICYKYFYLELFNKKSQKRELDWIIWIWWFSDFLIDKKFIQILKEHFKKQPTIEQTSFNYCDLLNMEDIIEELFNKLNLK